MKLTLVLLFVLLTGLASAQQVEPARMRAIWTAAENQMSVQTDAWYDDGDYPRVIQLLWLENGLNPSDYDLATNLGWMLENVEDWGDALAVYISFKNANPHDPDAAYPEAFFYFMKKAYAKIPPLMEPAVKLKPQANAYRLLAHSYERLGLLKDSERVWKAYLARFSDDGPGKLNLKRVQQKLAGTFKRSPTSGPQPKGAGG